MTNIFILKRTFSYPPSITEGCEFTLSKCLHQAEGSFKDSTKYICIYTHEHAQLSVCTKYIYKFP